MIFSVSLIRRVLVVCGLLLTGAAHAPGAWALDAIAVEEGAAVTELTDFTERYEAAGRRLSIETPEGGQLVLSAGEEAEGGGEWWLLALRNRSDAPVERVLLNRHGLLAGSGLFWPTPASGRIERAEFVGGGPFGIETRLHSQRIALTIPPQTTLTLALPGSAAAAVLIAAMLIHGIRPGPLLMTENPEFLYQIVAILLLSTIAITIFGLSLTRPVLLVLQVPRERLMPIVYVLCVVGSFAITQRMFDVYVMLIFGVVGFILREMKYPMAPLVLGIILGDLLDLNLRRGLLLTQGDPSPFFFRPISMVLWIIILTSILMSIPAVSRRVRSLFNPRAAANPD